MFASQPKSASKEQFLEQAKAARIERAHERRRDQAASAIQAVIRGFLVRQRLRREFRQEFDSVLRDGEGEEASTPLATSALDVFHATRKFLFTFHPKVDKEESYVSVALNKEHTVLWIQQLKGILGNCCGYLKEIRPECPQDAKSLMLHLHVLVTFTSTSSWKVLKDKTCEPLRPVLSQLCASVASHLMGKGCLYGALQALLLRGLARAKPSLKRAPLVATINLALRPLITGQFSEDLMNLFLLHILSVPALVHHLLNIAPEAVTLLNSHGLFRRSLDILVVEQNMRIIFNALEGNYALCLLANLVHLAYLNIEAQRLVRWVFFVQHVSTKLLESCQKYVVNKRSNLTHWHPILGWFAQSIDHGLHESLAFVKQQLQLLWCGPLVKVLFSPLAEMLAQNDNSNSSNEAPTFQSPQPDVPTNVLGSPASATASSLLKKALERASSGRTCSVQYRRLGSPEVTAVALTCALFETALAGLTQLRLDILTGLCHHEWVLCQLWQLIRSVGPASGVRAFLDLLAFTTKPTGPEFRLLVLFCDCATHLVTILDDLELYEQQRPFTLDDLVAISAFLNTFVFRLVWNGLIDLKTVNTNQLFCSCHTLLMVLYKRDCRRSYTPPDHWLIKDVKVSTFMSDLEKGKKAAAGSAPEGAPHHPTQRGQDGYQQLAMLPPQGLKGVIRVRFINEQGLDEAGIDQDGVFKEFLEETIKRVFDPSLNLFRATSEQRLYPSPTSYIHENHLSLFEFVGKMLGKAVYEGIVVDVPFASFFLSQLLGHQHSALYSSIDELPSLDADLYRSLTCVKHYEGDVQDLDLTFSLN
ncbi:hypothetical protein HPB50_011235 [Hyalomma asiaticum]|uniref:Uncharacterized protein n=1 Tax=Hyalomma asiaticum TaxID=266040 RepID=A0ACB7SG09_HYAAI|nr:hypothetical protein HPB50_011235 [Hyalomma asiaticum]